MSKWKSNFGKQREDPNPLVRKKFKKKFIKAKKKIRRNALIEKLMRDNTSLRKRIKNLELRTRGLINYR